MNTKKMVIVLGIILLYMSCGNGKYIDIVKFGAFNDYPDVMIGDLTDVLIDNGATVEYEYLRADDGKDYVNINIEDEDLNDIILQFQVSLKRGKFKVNAIELNGEEGNDYDINEFIDILMTEYEQYY